MRSLLQKLNTDIIEVIDVDDNRTVDNDNQGPRNQKYQNIIQDTTTNKSISLLLLWMYTCTRQQSNFKSLPMGILMDGFNSRAKQDRTDAAQGTESGALNR